MADATYTPGRCPFANNETAAATCVTRHNLAERRHRCSYTLLHLPKHQYDLRPMPLHHGERNFYGLPTTNASNDDKGPGHFWWFFCLVNT